MIVIPKIKLEVNQAFQVKLSNGANAGAPIQPGKYVARANLGQQPVWYKLYAADANWDQIGEPLANVYLVPSPNGWTVLSAF
jgi:hypothetical protein